jgi:hypothetical protein
LKEEMNSSKRDDFTVYSLLKVMKNEHSNWEFDQILSAIWIQWDFQWITEK